MRARAPCGDMAWLVLGFALVLALAPRAGSAQRFGAGRPPQQPGLGQRPGGAPGWGGAGGANYPSYGDSDGLGSPCNYDEDCDAMEHTYCRNQRTCECKKGFRASASNDRCLATVGAPCSTKYDCSGLGSAGECRQGVCDCGGDHVPSPDGSCLKAALRINDVCEEDLQCEGLGLGPGQQQQQQQHPWGQGASTGATCVAGKCQCAPGTHPSNDRCVANRALHEPCSENSECFIGDGYQSVVTCHMGTCRCRTHYVDLGDGKCTAGAKNVNTASTPAIMLLVLLMLFVVNK